MIIKLSLKKNIMTMGLIILLLTSVLFLAHGNALSEFTDDYENENYVASKTNVVRNAVLDAMELYYTALTVMTDSVIQVREHNIYSNPSYNPVWTFSKIDVGENLRQYSNDASMGAGYIMLVVDRNFIDGKYLRFNWEGRNEFSKTAQKVFLYDGGYDRSNNIHFPNGANKLLMGNGLIQTIASPLAGTTWTRTDDVLIDASGGVLDNVTIFWQLNDAWNTIWVRMDVNWIEVNTGAGGIGNLFTEQLNGTLTMELTGTLGDYGRVDSDVLPYHSGGYTSGNFYTTEVLSSINGSSIVLLTNSTLDGEITVEFSSDNNTWLDHNGVVGSDNLIAGNESIDIRDLSYDTLYMRYNFTSGSPSQTPRLYQIRVIASGECPGNGNGNGEGSGAIGFIVASFILIPIILIFVWRRKRRR